ncbi:MAG: hypothetical protein ACRD0G_14725, partial [Acidimicrobiales bacterium]
MSDDEPRDETSDTGEDEAPPEPADAAVTRPARSLGRVVQFGCVVVMVLGALGAFFGFGSVLDTEGGRCTQAERIVEDRYEDDDDEVPDDEQIDVDEAECDQVLAEADRLDEDVPSESEIRTIGLVLAGIGLVQLVSGFITVRTRQRLARNIAAASAVAGILIPILGIVTILFVGFAIYALLF